MKKSRKIIITALTDKGKEAASSTGKTSKMEKAVLKMFKVKETIINEKPLTVETTFKNVPEIVFQQITIGLYSKFKELGAEKDLDYKMEVK